MIQNLQRIFSKRAFYSIALIFSVNALLFTFWITRIPEVKDRLDISEGALGLVLFCMPVGALIAMLMTNHLTQRFGAGRVTIASTIIFACCMLMPLHMPNIYLLGFSLFVVGIFTGIMDIAMNAVAATLEAQHKQLIMSTCHGFFSLGGMIGAGIGSLMIGWEIDANLQMLAGVVFCLAMTILVLTKEVMPVKEQNVEEDGGGWAFPTRAILGLVVISFCTMQGEGVIADWSAIFMEDVVQANGFLIGLGYFGFATSMTLGRFYGDSIIEQAGPRKVVWVSGAIIVAGLVLVLPAIAWLSILGFTLAGAGYALLVPVLFSEAAKTPGISPAKGIASVASFGYFGFLVGPTIIGGIAEFFSLQISFTYLVVLTALAIFFGGRKIRA
ncbi:MAG: MFS transporter [Bacteroidia bacterium]